MTLASTPFVHRRAWLAQALITTLIVFSALVAVGVTAPREAPFTIAIRPEFLTLGVEVEIKVWTLHFRFGWSALPSTASTKTDTLPI
jgi:hypothetical protein